MKEGTCNSLDLKEIEGPVLQALTSAKYGDTSQFTSKLLLPLFAAADAYQVLSCMLDCIYHTVFSCCCTHQKQDYTDMFHVDNVQL